MNPKKPKTSSVQRVDNNPVEALRSLGGGIVQSAKGDLGKAAIHDTWDQILGNYKETKKETEGTLQEGEELNLSALEEQKQLEKRSDVEPGIDYRGEVLHAEKRAEIQETHELKQTIEQIRVELKQLITTVEMQVEYGKIVVEQAPVTPGKYHETFFIWLLSFVRSMNAKVQESASWLAMFQSKKKQKGYWNMFKKHGTTFGLSNERVVATQTG